MSERTSGASTGAAQIRDIVADLVGQVVAPIGGTAYRARSFPVKPTAFPAILVYGYDEVLTLQTMTPADYQGSNVCQMVVQGVVTGRDPLDVETNLETLIGLLRATVMQCEALGGEAGAIERILSVRTTRQVKTEDVIIGEAIIVFEMQWSEEYTLQYDPTGEVDLIVTRNGQPVMQLDITIPPNP